MLFHVSVSIFGDFTSVLREASLTILLHVSVSIFRDCTSVLGQGKQVWLFFFTSQCLYLEILRECWGRGSKFDYTSSHLSVYIQRFYVSVGAGEASLTILPHVSLSIFRDFTSVLGRESKFDYTSSRLSVYIQRFCVSFGAGEASLTTSSYLSVYIWRFCVSVGAGEAGLTILLHVSVAIFRDFTSVLGQQKQV